MLPDLPDPRATHAAKIADFHFHDLRHTAASCPRQSLFLTSDSKRPAESGELSCDSEHQEGLVSTP